MKKFSRVKTYIKQHFIEVLYFLLSLLLAVFAIIYSVKIFIFIPLLYGISFASEAVVFFIKRQSPLPISTPPQTKVTNLFTLPAYILKTGLTDINIILRLLRYPQETGNCLI